MMGRPLVITLADRSTVAVWPLTGRATVVARADGTHDQDREHCLASDFAGYGPPPAPTVCRIEGTDEC